MGNERSKGRASQSEAIRLAKGAEDMRKKALYDMLTFSVDLGKQKIEYDKLVRKGLKELS